MLNVDTHVHTQTNYIKDCFLSMSWLKHFNCSLPNISATCTDYDILAHLSFPYIHICLDFLFNWELKNRRTMLVPSGLAIRRTEMISKKFPVSTLSRTQVYKKGWPTFCSRPAVPLQHSQLYYCWQCSPNREQTALACEHLLANGRLHDPYQFSPAGKCLVLSSATQIHWHFFYRFLLCKIQEQNSGTYL